MSINFLNGASGDTCQSDRSGAYPCYNDNTASYTCDLQMEVMYIFLVLVDLILKVIMNQAVSDRRKNPSDFSGTI